MTRSKANIILASASGARQSMLRNVGIDFTAIPADINEQTIIDAHMDKGTDIGIITANLAENKALHISKHHPDSLIIGSDQTLEFQGTLLSKAENAKDAEEKLKALRGNSHILRSSVCVMQDQNLLFSHTSSAELTMHDFDDTYLRSYMKSDPDALISCVGGYKIEGAGAWLFSSITGDVFTIMGMPLLPLLGFLRKECKILP